MERWVVEVHGIVQGVGFRPYIYGLAVNLGLGGFVRNRADRVDIEVEGEAESLDRFLRELMERPPPLAQIERVATESRPPQGERTFHIEISEAAVPGGPISVSPDAATCSECRAELFDPQDRRFEYPFLNCTHCGPRLTIVTGAPYDRPQTTMAGFAMCAACQAEYENPADRRFHAQPIACPACGPRLELLDTQGGRISGPDPLAAFAAALRQGQIGAIKGLGGFHLACDASNHEAVAELRLRKHRDEKPFAVMVPDLDAARNLCVIGSREAELLQSPRAPIVLLRKRERIPLSGLIAPGNAWLGVMLPYSPLHLVLMRAVGGIPLVMTSGNRSDEPIAYRDDAVEKLAGIADLFLTHNRPIHIRCDDSVTRVVAGAEMPVRRSRGYAPRPIRLPFEAPGPILATGGQLKAAFALAAGNQVFLSHHLGDLDHYEAYRAFETDAELYEKLVGIAPGRLACDLHPDYATTRYAENRSERSRIPLHRVQHHHAHVASCMAENGLNEPVIGVAFDGTGYGTDGTIWGGEFLVGDYREFRRAAHLRVIRMPGGERAIREPWRMAAAYLLDAGIGLEPLRARGLHTKLDSVRTQWERRLNSPLTSSMGRLFDAVAALAGVRQQVTFEGQAAIELEGRAAGVPEDETYPFDVDEAEPMVLDARPLIRAVVSDVQAGVDAAVIARRFHSTVVIAIAAVCGRLRESTGLDAVALSGGVFLNALLVEEACERLREDGFRVYRHRLVPPNDGGISLGQVAIAAVMAAP